MNRDQLLRRLDTAWRDFHAACDAVPDEALQTPLPPGDWSVRDLVAHVTIWEEEALKYLPVLLAGQRPPRYSDSFGGIDAFNALMVEQRRSTPFPELLRQHQEVHRRLVDYVRAAPEDQIERETPFRRRLRLDTYGHYRLHARDLRQSMERQEDTP